MQLTETKAIELANLAIKSGFYLKRSYAVKLDLARQIKESLNLSCTGEEMLEHLTATKPVIKKATKPAKEMQPTFAGSALSKERDRAILSGNKFIITRAEETKTALRPGEQVKTTKDLQVTLQVPCGWINPTVHASRINARKACPQNRKLLHQSALSYTLP